MLKKLVRATKQETSHDTTRLGSWHHKAIVTCIKASFDNGCLHALAWVGLVWAIMKDEVNAYERAIIGRFLHVPGSTTGSGQRRTTKQETRRHHKVTWKHEGTRPVTRQQFGGSAGIRSNNRNSINTTVLEVADANNQPGGHCAMYMSALLRPLA